MSACPERRRVGRPPLVEGDTTTPVTIVLPSRQYDDLDRQAKRQRLGLREFLRRKLSDDDADE